MSDPYSPRGYDPAAENLLREISSWFERLPYLPGPEIEKDRDHFQFRIESMLADRQHQRESEA